MCALFFHFPGHVLRILIYIWAVRRMFRVDVIDQKTLEGTTHCGWENICCVGTGMGLHSWSVCGLLNLDWVEIDENLEGRALHGDV